MIKLKKLLNEKTYRSEDEMGDAMRVDVEDLKKA